jgi:hypothetical protein
MSRLRPTRSLLVRTSGVVAVAVIATGCAGTAAGPAWTESAVGHALPGPVTAVSVPAAHAVAAVRALARPASTGTVSPTSAGIQAASVSTGAATGTSPAGGASGTASAAGAPHVYLTIVTGEMIRKTDYPAYIPSSSVLPAYSTVVVTVTVTDFDNATPLPAALQVYAHAQGIVGDAFTVTPIDPKTPNATAGPTTTHTSLDPADVAHTLTAPGLGLNVPIAAHSRVTFTIRAGAPGTYTWHCMDPCGSGPTGWGGAMAAQSGYMEGTITVA